MKTYLVIAYTMLFGAWMFAGRATVGCMDNSKHTDTSDGYDYKTLHYVHCDCPCERYRRIERWGQCMQCRHYRKTSTPWL